MEFTAIEVENPIIATGVLLFALPITGGYWRVIADRNQAEEQFKSAQTARAISLASIGEQVLRRDGPTRGLLIAIEGLKSSGDTSVAPATQTLPIETTVDYSASVVSGQVLGSDGKPAPFANVRLLISDPCGSLIGVSSKSADEQGRFSWDWVPNTIRNRIVAVAAEGDEGRPVDFTG